MAIEARTGAEVVVYTQDSGDDPTTDDARRAAAALIDQWHVGRAGFDDGLAIFFDLVTVPVCCIALLKWGRLGHSSHALG